MPKARGVAPQRYLSPKLVINVTAEHIERGKIAHSSRCMVAEAIKDAYPQYINPTADMQTIRLSCPVRQLRYIYMTPKEPHTAIIMFDAGIHPQPFTFVLKRASAVVRTANWRAIHGKKPAPEGKLPLLGPKHLQLENSGGRGVPTVVGGNPPRRGPLGGRARGSGTHGKAATANFGTHRIFGLRALESHRIAMLKQLHIDPATDELLQGAEAARQAQAASKPNE